MPSHALTALRDLLADLPSQNGWATLCRLIDEVADEDRPVLLDYAHAHLTDWPDALRVAPPTWGTDGADPRLHLARSLAAVGAGGALVPLATFESAETPALSQLIDFLDAQGASFGVHPRTMRWRHSPDGDSRVTWDDGLIRVERPDGTPRVERRVAPPGSAEHHNVVFAHDPAFIWWLTGFRSGVGAVRLLSARTLDTIDTTSLPDRIYGARMETEAPVLAVSSGPFAQWLTFFGISGGRLAQRPVRLEGAQDLLPMGLCQKLDRYVGLGRGGALAVWTWSSAQPIHRDAPHQRHSLPSLGALSSGGLVAPRLVVPIQSTAPGSRLIGVAFVDAMRLVGQGEARLPTGATGQSCVAEVLSPNLLLVQEIGWKRAWLYRVLAEAQGGETGE